MNIQQLRDYVVMPALHQLDLYSVEAEVLVLGTGAVESRYQYLVQVGGPAAGFWQMEMATHRDIWVNYLRHKRDLVMKILPGPIYDSVDDIFYSALSCWEFADTMANQLIYDLRYAAMMCRIHYRRVREPLPPANDPHKQGMYWKRYYNTEGGKGTVEHYEKAFTMVQGTANRIVGESEWAAELARSIHG